MNAIIIGASSGLGRRIAEIYISRGGKVGVAARRLEPLKQLRELAPERVEIEPIDVTAEDAAAHLTALAERLGEVDLIFNVAGVGFANPDLTAAKDDSIAATNCGGFTRIVDAAFRYFAAKGRPGRIAAITSIAGTRGLGVAAAYSASKRYQSTYLTALDQLARMRHLPIAITDIRPGFIDTDLLDHSRKYPMLMNPDRAAQLIVRAVDRKRRVAVIDRRWAILTALWSLIPRPLWVRLPVKL